MPCFKCKRKISLAELLSVAKCVGCLELYCSAHRGLEHENECLDYKKYIHKQKIAFDEKTIHLATKPNKLDTV
jgi:hypothetical protein